jgi:hypothetical protein
LAALSAPSRARAAPAVALGHSEHLLEQWLVDDSLAKLAPALALSSDNDTDAR